MSTLFRIFLLLVCSLSIFFQGCQGLAMFGKNNTTWGAKPLIQPESFQKIDLVLLLDPKAKEGQIPVTGEIDDVNLKENRKLLEDAFYRFNEKSIQAYSGPLSFSMEAPVEKVSLDKNDPTFLQVLQGGIAVSVEPENSNYAKAKIAPDGKSIRIEGKREGKEVFTIRNKEGQRDEVSIEVKEMNFVMERLQKPLKIGQNKKLNIKKPSSNPPTIVSVGLLDFKTNTDAMGVDTVETAQDSSEDATALKNKWEEKLKGVNSIKVSVAKNKVVFTRKTFSPDASPMIDILKIAGINLPANFKAYSQKAREAKNKEAVGQFASLRITDDGSTVTVEGVKRGSNSFLVMTENESFTLNIRVGSLEKEDRSALPVLAQRLRRNQIQERIIAASNQRCSDYKKLLKSLDSETNFGLGSLTTILGGVGAIVTNVDTVRSLAGAAGITSGVQAQFNQDYFANLTIQVLTNGFESKRREIYNDIKTSQALNVDNYNIQAAVKDAISYHDNCSLNAGLVQVALAIPRAEGSQLKTVHKTVKDVLSLNETMGLGTEHLKSKFAIETLKVPIPVGQAKKLSVVKGGPIKSIEAPADGKGTAATLTLAANGMSVSVEGKAPGSDDFTFKNNDDEITYLRIKTKASFKMKPAPESPVRIGDLEPYKIEILEGADSLSKPEPQGNALDFASASIAPDSKALIIRGLKDSKNAEVKFTVHNEFEETSEVSVKVEPAPEFKLIPPLGNEGVLLVPKAAAGQPQSQTFRIDSTKIANSFKSITPKNNEVGKFKTAISEDGQTFTFTALNNPDEPVLELRDRYNNKLEVTMDVK